MDNLTQILTEVLVNADKNGSKINLDDVIKEVIRSEVEKTVNEILGHELTAFLGYEKSEQGASKECGNSRNGFLYTWIKYNIWTNIIKCTSRSKWSIRIWNV